MNDWLKALILRLHDQLYETAMKQGAYELLKELGKKTNAMICKAW